MGCCPDLISNKDRLTIAYWKIFYGDDSIYTSKKTKWEDLPKDNVQCLILYFADKTRKLFHGDDYYFKCGDLYWGIGEAVTSVQDILDRYPEAIILRGKAIEEWHWADIMDCVYKDQYEE
jgi:hypothetical protein